MGILAHVDAGKTTLAERILYHARVIRSFGRVDEQKAYMDYNDIERERGITVFSEAAGFSLGEHVITLIDTPGHADFSAETERAVSVMDYAILVVSATDGVQSHTRTLWELLRQYKIPTFIFINKTDATTADRNAAFYDIKTLLSDNVVDFSGDFSEALAEKSEKLFEEYIENGSVKLSHEVRRLVAECEVYPCFFGSALRDEGVSEFILAATELMREKTHKDGFRATCYKVRRDKDTRLCYVKIDSGEIKVKDVVATFSGDRKIDEIRMPVGGKFVPVKSAQAGQVVAVLGLYDVLPGDVIGENPGRNSFITQPIFSSKVLFDSHLRPRDVLEKLRILEDEDPTLSVRFIEELDEIEISVMGKISLQVIEYEFFRRFGIKITFGPCGTVLRETVKSEVTGYGHFEPLRHYAEVHIRIEPQKEGARISFGSEVPTDELSQDVQNLIRTHVLEKAHKGVLCGAELCDVRYVLVAGRVHEKHTEGGDLREATYRAIRQGLMNAKSVVLEPMYAFSVRSDMSLAAKLMAEVKKMNGETEVPYSDGSVVTTVGRAPARLFAEYMERLVSDSGGKASVFVKFDGYAPSKEQEKIVAETGYDPERDIENTPDSVFCSHGAGYTVKWYEAKEHMHCK